MSWAAVALQDERERAIASSPRGARASPVTTPGHAPSALLEGLGSPEPPPGSPDDRRLSAQLHHVRNVANAAACYARAAELSSSPAAPGVFARLPAALSPSAGRAGGRRRRPLAPGSVGEEMPAPPTPTRASASAPAVVSPPEPGALSLEEEVVFAAGSGEALGFPSPAASPPDEEWACGVCTRSSPASAAKCRVCGAKRAVPAPPSREAREAPDDDQAKELQHMRGLLQRAEQRVAAAQQRAEAAERDSRAQLDAEAERVVALRAECAALAASGDGLQRELASTRLAAAVRTWMTRKTGRAFFKWASETHAMAAHVRYVKHLVDNPGRARSSSSSAASVPRRRRAGAAGKKGKRRKGKKKQAGVLSAAERRRRGEVRRQRELGLALEGSGSESSDFQQQGAPKPPAGSDASYYRPLVCLTCGHDPCSCVPDSPKAGDERRAVVAARGRDGSSKRRGTFFGTYLPVEALVRVPASPRPRKARTKAGLPQPPAAVAPVVSISL